jgi:uncharacterized protein (TIGR02118 family)
MIKVSVFYPNGPGAKFDMNYYYLKSHMPMVQKTLGAVLKGMAVEEGLGGIPPGSPAPFLAAGHLLFDSVEIFGAAFTAHAESIMADIPNYTNIQPTIQIGLIRL